MRHRWLFIFEQQWRPGFTQVPLDVVGQHREQDVRAHALLEIVMDRPNFQVDALERAKGPFNTRQLLV